MKLATITINWLKVRSLDPAVPENIRKDLQNFILEHEGIKKSNPLGMALKEKRQIRGLTLAQAAEISNLSKAEWLSFEEGTDMPAREPLLKIAQCLQLDAFDLLDAAFNRHKYFSNKEG